MERIYPIRPWIAVSVVVMRDGKMLAIQRGHEPGKGLWAVPGGMVDLGETATEAARREAREETGLEVEIGEIFWIADAIGRDGAGRVRYHNVIVDFLATAPEGEPACADDAMDVRWVGPDDVDGVPFTPSMYPMLEKLFGRRFVGGTSAG